MEIIHLENGPFLVNTYLVINTDTNTGFIIDPGSDIDPLIQKIESDGITITAILATHGHIDHIGGVNKFKEKYSVPLYANDGDKEFIDTVAMQARMFGVPDPGSVTIDKILPSSGKIEVAGIPITLIHTPGHSKGSLSLKIENIVFSGDSLFNMSIGRTDLPGGDYDELIASIREQLFTLPGDTRILPGHGPETTIEREKTMNPFF